MKKNKPSIAIKFQNESFKVLELNGKAGDALSAHKVDHDALLIVLEGVVIYSEAEENTKLHKGDVQAITKNVIHALKFEEPSELLLTYSPSTKMRFAKT